MGYLVHLVRKLRNNLLRGSLASVARTFQLFDRNYFKRESELYAAQDLNG